MTCRSHCANYESKKPNPSEAAVEDSNGKLIMKAAMALGRHWSCHLSLASR